MFRCRERCAVIFSHGLPPDPAILIPSFHSAALRLKEPFDLRATLSSGAAFCWGRYDRRGRLLAYGEPDAQGWFTAPTYGVVLRLRQPSPSRVEVECTRPEIRAGGMSRPMPLGEFVKWYFRMEEKFSDILPRLARDPRVSAAGRMLPGLRLIRVDPVECLLSFLCSPQNRIAKIAAILNAVSRRYGTRQVTPIGACYHPPPPGMLASVRAASLAACGLRYGTPQARNIIRTFRRLADRESFFRENAASVAAYSEAHRRVQETCLGAGPKVADCVCLFALGHTEAVPVDVHVFNATVRLYRRNLRGLRAKDADFLSLREYARIGAFYRRKFGRDAGYAQQFLFTAQRLRLLAGAASSIHPN